LCTMPWPSLSRWVSGCTWTGPGVCLYRSGNSLNPVPADKRQKSIIFSIRRMQSTRCDGLHGMIIPRRCNPWQKKPHDPVTISGFAWQQRLASLYYFIWKGIVGLSQVCQNLLRKYSKGGNTDYEKIVVILHDYDHGRNSVRDVVCYRFHSFVTNDFIHHNAACHNLRVLWNSSPDNQ